MLKIIGKYTTALVTNDNTDENAIQQIYNIVNCKAYDGQTIVIQPDAHCGKGSVIGFCCTVGKYIDPNTVGVDIGCEISMHQYDKPIPVEKYKELNKEILTKCGWGCNVSPKKEYNNDELYKFFSASFKKAKILNNKIFNSLPDNVTEKWISDMLKRIGMDEHVWYYSINSFGSGNHYCEYNESIDNTKYGISIHCGSRNFGLKVCKYWSHIANNMYLSKAELKEATNKFKTTYLNNHKNMLNFKNDLNIYINKKQENYINGFLTGDNMIGYFCDMYVALTYSRFNHEILHRTIDKIVAKYNCKCINEIISVHNYIDFSNEIPLIRKGAIRSYKGEIMLLPFNMRDGVAVCEGKSNDLWLNSCAHGAGRKMSRSAAKAALNVEDFQNTMADAGIYTTTANISTLDEAPDAYKPKSEIIENIKDTCDILYFMKPKINIKAAE